MSVQKGVREQHEQIPLADNGICADIYYSPRRKFNPGALYIQAGCRHITL